ncbi:hypothetical protein [Rhodococcus opacus]|uniref:hypothetical protein n=1 Tax=Rhodococcus opacus TaxID=37919 RepID=UPI0029494F00|nr:hypothetical protein [Rhodococcus opacus]MDV6247069.1 hypothetical protein [Rhodococcus opacus]
MSDETATSEERRYPPAARPWPCRKTRARATGAYGHFGDAKKSVAEKVTDELKAL